ncbi:MAG: hypothetical protein NC321_02530 [Clostridium sp.]|nr:hypothetical protein [Clostridium sp.]
MLDLFFRYKQVGDSKRALLVGQNMVNLNPANKDCFEAYFDYLISLAQSDDILVAKSFLQQATGVLAFFSENVKIDEETVEFIIGKENELNRVAVLLKKQEENANREVIRQEVTYHNDALELIEQLLEKIEKCERLNDFNKYIDNLGKVDQSIDQDRFSERQKEKYAVLMQKSSNIVNSKLTYFENIKNREYNIDAIEAYSKIFNMFKNGKVADDHKDVIKALFMFDASKLYNETLVYYNHVYNYILSKLSDEEKFTLTKYAILCEKKR